MTHLPTRLCLALAIALGATAGALADPARDAILAGYEKAAGEPLSADRGKAFFNATHAGGKPDTPTCTTCHTANPKAAGKTRAGKAIEPMAVSANPNRFTDPAFVEKWFGRNCNSVLGRDCTTREKGDVITWLSNL
ncbi:nitrate reductase [Zhengella mangrovi]|uniref:Nitrate reductase n=1 Tax=Zhengella mangrovi TaxID=1982044 RepID=A0A2G1QU92_9HYPH|nr:DUF1924 domain-containing protein [Zhengella mangrovi]PHP69029.1 nitrate reductase [Zhengella mangrovi]